MPRRRQPQKLCCLITAAGGLRHCRLYWLWQLWAGTRAGGRSLERSRPVIGFPVGSWNRPDSNHSGLSCTRWDEWGADGALGRLSDRKGTSPTSCFTCWTGFTHHLVWVFVVSCVNVFSCYLLHAGILKELLPKAHSRMNFFCDKFLICMLSLITRRKQKEPRL